MNCALSFSRSRVSDPPAESRSTTARTSIRSGQHSTNFSPCAQDLLRPVGVEKRMPSLAGVLWLGRIGPVAKPENQVSLDWREPENSEVARIKRSADPAPSNDSTASKYLCRIGVAVFLDAGLYVQIAVPPATEFPDTLQQKVNATAYGQARAVPCSCLVPAVTGRSGFKSSTYA